MVNYNHDDEDTSDITLENEKFNEVYRHYLSLLQKVTYIENFESIILSLRTDDNLDVNVREDVNSRIENDIHDGILTKPTKSLDEFI